MGGLTWLTPPHVTEDLNMTGDLLLSALCAGRLEVVDEELVAPPATTTGICGPGRLPVEAEAYGQARLAQSGAAVTRFERTLYEDLLDVL